MSDPARSFLASLQLADSALPIGRFVHSGGLESLLGGEAAAGAEEIVELVESAVHESVGPLDGVAVAHAQRAAARAELAALLALDRQVTARKLTPASRLASSACGQALAALAPSLSEAPLVRELSARVAAGATDGNLAVVEGALAASLRLSCREAVLLELRSAAAALLSAAVRLGRLTATQAQAALRRCEPVIVAAADAALEQPAEAMRSSALELEVHALRHGRAEGRLFAT